MTDTAASQSESLPPITECDPASYGHVGLPIDDRCSLCGAEWVVEQDGGVVVESVVRGGPGTTPKPCDHRQLNQQLLYAPIVDDDDRVLRIDVKVKARCALCGAPMRFLIDSAHPSETDGDRGLVCTVEAVLDVDGDGWRVGG